MDDGVPPRALRILYAVIIAAVALGGVLAIVDWARRGDELPGGAVPVIGRVVEERPGFTGALAIVEVTYQAGGRERRARLPVAGSDDNPGVTTFEPGDPIALLVARDNPDRVQQEGWGSNTPPSRIPGWVLALGAVGLLAPVVLPGPRRRLQAALSGALKTGGGRGI
ncbi:MAG TPA: hypothetical protein VGR20_19720 [Acidimicrobiia bacterium]|nr:hypothetical protein [Acidimicrobiia bacterium]